MKNEFWLNRMGKAEVHEAQMYVRKMVADKIGRNIRSEAFMPQTEKI
jgi:hypothetical protein